MAKFAMNKIKGVIPAMLSFWSGWILSYWKHRSMLYYDGGGTQSGGGYGD